MHGRPPWSPADPWHNSISLSRSIYARVASTQTRSARARPAPAPMPRAGGAGGAGGAELDASMAVATQEAGSAWGRVASVPYKESTKNGSMEWTDKSGNPWQPGAGMQYRRFGRTNLRLPVFSCGGMRFMYGADLLRSKLGGRYICSGLCTIALLVAGIPLAVAGGMTFKVVLRNPPVPWGTVSGVVALCYYGVLGHWYTRGNQANLQSTLEASFESGITHVETAKMYGTSEKQIGNAFEAIWKKGKFRRDDIVLQTKIRPTDDREKLIAGVNDSLKKLKTECIDLLAIHGVNSEKECEQAMKCADWIQDEFIRPGKVKHLGFSTHARTSVIVQAINTNKFSFVNLHKHYFGSYSDLDNMPAVEAARDNDMGVFIISPTDKGGKLYDPTPKVVDACAPLHPMLWHDLYLLSRVPGVNVLSLGAAEPGNFEEHLKALSYLGTDEGERLVDEISAKLERCKLEAMGKEYLAQWSQGLPYYDECTEEQINVRVILWLRLLVKSFDMVAYAKERYSGMSLTGMQSSWYPGGNAERAQELSVAISQACAANPMKDEIPAQLAEMHALLTTK